MEEDLFDFYLIGDNEDATLVNCDEEGHRLSLLSSTVSPNDHKFLWSQEPSLSLDVELERGVPKTQLELDEELAEQLFELEKKAHWARIDKDEAIALRVQAQEKEAFLRKHKQYLADKELAMKYQVKFGLSSAAFECPVCLDDIEAGKGIRLSCSHSICLECFTFYVSQAISNTDTLECPQGCGSIVTSREIKIVLDDTKAERYAEIEQLKLKQSIAGLWHCRTPDCNNAVEMVKRLFGRTIRKYVCPGCKKAYCINCNSDWHENISCRKYQKWVKMNKQGDDALTKLIKKGQVALCKCGAAIQKNGGCNLMTCSTCSNKFCWECKKFLKPGEKCKHTSYH